MKNILKKLLIIALFLTVIISQVQAFQYCSTDMQITFKDGYNLVIGLTEGIKIFY